MSYNKILDKDIASIKGDIIKIIEATKSQYAKTFNFLKTSDLEIAKEVVASDQEINEIQNQFVKMALWKIAKQQMVAGDLRLAIGGILIAREIERIADYAKLICRFSFKFETKNADDFKYISILFDLVNQMLNTVASIVENYEETQEKKVIQIESELNRKFKEVNDTMIENLINNKLNEEYLRKNIGILKQLKNLERAGDHLINIEEILIFIRTGVFGEISTENII